MAEFTLNKFRDFINNVSDDIFPGTIQPPKIVDFKDHQNLQERILQIITEYPNKNANHVGPRFNAICNECKGLKHKDEVRNALQRIHDAELAAQANDGRWYLLQKSNRKDLQG